MADNGFRTLAAGLYTPLSAGYAVIEDESKARLMLVRPDGTSAGEFVNRANGDNYHLGWSRFIAKDQGDAALSRLREAKCHA
jgi:hypothetical protein